MSEWKRKDHILKIYCRRFDSKIINVLEYDNGQQFSLEAFDYGSHILLFKSLDDISKVKIILEELSYPSLCHVIEVSINENYIKRQRRAYEHLIEKHSNWIDYNVKAWDIIQLKWKHDIFELIESFKDKNVILKK